jgi:deazaflavin-dependent oxidoreductase (nitroreductase family)
MDKKQDLSVFERMRAWLEAAILTRFVPMDSPGLVFRLIFKIPILFYRLGLGGLVGPHFLLLTTTGRKSGKTYYTPLEFSSDKKTGGYIVMAGWGGKTDWYRNALANPRVKVQIGWQKFEAESEPIPHLEVAQMLLEISKKVPRMVAVWQRWCDKPIDGSLASYIYAAQFFPSLRLTPVKKTLK